MRPQCRIKLDGLVNEVYGEILASATLTGLANVRVLSSPLFGLNRAIIAIVRLGSLARTFDS